MTTCFYCSKPMMTVVNTTDSKLLPVCEKHYFRHVDNTKAREDMERSERLAMEAYRESSVLRNIGDKHMEDYHAARRRLK